MKTLKSFTLVAAGLLLAGVANAQVSAPRPGLPGPGSLTISNTPGPNNLPANTSRADRSEDSYVQQLGTGQYASVIQNNFSDSHLDIVQTSSATNANAYQEQYSGLSGGSSAYIKQNGQRDVASQYQEGKGNLAVADQSGPGYSNRSYQEQVGNNNSADIHQTGLIGGNMAQQVQQGNGNFARTTQDYQNSWSIIEQRGTGNTALVKQQ